MKFSIFAVLLTVSFVVASAENVEQIKTSKDDSSFYDKRKQGWYWFEEDTKEPVEKKIEKPIVTVKPQPTEKKNNDTQSKEVSIDVVIDAKWLRENLPALRDTAINAPTKENLSAYYYAQRMTMDMASRFANRTKEFFQQETMLDENLRRPTANFAINASKREVSNNKELVLQEIFKNVGIWMFIKSDCTYCMQQMPVMEELTRAYGVDVLYVSLDGAKLPGHSDEKYVFDVSGNVRKKLGYEVELTPTLVLMNPKTKDAIMLNVGMISLKGILDKTLLIANKEGWVSSNTYNKTQMVKDISALKGNKTHEVTITNKDQLNKSLVDSIRENLKQQTRDVINIKGEDNEE